MEKRAEYAAYGPMVDLEWNGVRVLGRDALKVMNWFTRLLEEESESRKDHSSMRSSGEIPPGVRKVTLVMDADSLDQGEAENAGPWGIVVFNREDPHLVELSYQRSPSAWLLGRPEPELDGAWFDEAEGRVFTRWQGRLEATHAPKEIVHGDAAARIAFTAAVFLRWMRFGSGWREGITPLHPSAGLR